MSNSSLVNYRAWSPNYDSRGGVAIRDITIHHMAGNLSIETCGSVFRSRPASAHYGIGSDGRIGQYVDEAYAAWANGNFASNQRSVTIELANDQIGGNWHVSDKAIASCINLVADICKRNGIKRLNFTGTTSGNLTAHRMFMATACPGPYLYSKFPYIAQEVNKKLGSSSSGSGSSSKPATGKLTVDGYFGEASTRRLQSFLGLTPDGWVGGQTSAVKPYIPRWTVARFSDGYTGSTTVDRLQRYLKSKGYNPGDIDGLCGKQTITALQRFLKSYGPGSVDGIMGAKTAAAFQKFLNAQK